jgi:hypothetical protein
MHSPSHRLNWHLKELVWAGCVVVNSQELALNRFEDLGAVVQGTAVATKTMGGASRGAMTHPNTAGASLHQQGFGQYRHPAWPHVPDPTAFSVSSGEEVHAPSVHHAINVTL